MIDTIGSVQSVIAEFRDVYAAHVSKGKQEVRVSELPDKQRADWFRRDGELHPSSFPYCGLRHAYELLERPSDPIIDVDFGRDYFLPAGSVFHAAIQKWIGFSGQYVGDWHCQKCGRVHARRVHPKACKACGHTHLDYHELGGAWGKNVHWHTDGLFRTKSKRHWLVDFKTTSTYAIEQHRKTKTVFPYTTNRSQIESYIPLVEDLTSLDIDGWLLVYAARDNPNHIYKVEVVGGRVTAKQKTSIRQRLEQSDRDFTVARQVVDKPIKVFKRLATTKLCEDRDYYDHFVHDQWDPCPLHKQCFGNKLPAKLQAAVVKNQKE